MTVKQLLCFSMLFGSSCAGGRGEPQAHAPQAEAAKGGAGPSAAQQCLEDATAAREVPANAPGRIRVSQILVRHADLKDPHGATRSREEACLRALAALNSLKQGADWEQAVRDFSDANSADLGWIKQEDVQPTFASAAFDLEPEQLSYVVETDRGFHVILRRQ